ncbi:MAG: DUF2735 domain-containing protein [Alsobacter sp.]
MHGNDMRPSATIVQLSDRIRLRSLNRSAGSGLPGKVAPAPVIVTDGWYHDAAIREAGPERKG